MNLTDDEKIELYFLMIRLQLAAKIFSHTDRTGLGEAAWKKIEAQAVEYRIKFLNGDSRLSGVDNGRNEAV